MDKRASYIETEIGYLTITEKEGKINGLYFGKKELEQGYALEQSALIERCILQLREYFAGKRKEFELPLLMEGTEFQIKVWEALKTIPYGETRSYKDIAVQVNSPKAFRAVGGANHNNPVSIIVPWHRVIGANGGLVGFGGGLDIKDRLIQLEKSEVLE